MVCYSPKQVFFSGVRPNGKNYLSFARRNAIELHDRGFDVRKLDYFYLPCGQCKGCRLDRSMKWAVRCLHEADFHDKNCFITLTYDPEFLPKDGSLVYLDFQLFLKRLRKKFGSGIRFFMAGEYGDRLERPHYHAILFGHDFDDRVFHHRSGDSDLFTSEQLSALWGKGFVTVGDVSFSSIAYVARYIFKKINGDLAKDHYGDRLPEFCRMSNKPGIGAKYFEHFRGDLFPHDQDLYRNKKGRYVKVGVSRYYDKLLERVDPVEYERIKMSRKSKTGKVPLSTRHYLNRMASIKERSVTKLHRNFEEVSNG